MTSVPAATLCPSSHVENSVQHLGRDLGYVCDKVIGKGSFGAAVLVKDREGQDRIMKVIDLSGLNPRQREAAPTEPEIMKRLRHPYIVRYRESFLEKGMLAIVMDFAGAGNVLQQVEHARSQHQQSLPEERVVRYMAQALLGLKHMHSLNIIHRDLKSENLFLDSVDHLRIGDFGLARVMDRGAAVCVENHIVGTPYYLSPEICSQGVYSPASDMWALGCILCELATLGVPFDATNLPSLMMKITTKSAPRLPRSWPLELSELCWALLAKKRSARPSAQEALKKPMMRKAMEKLLEEATAKEEPRKVAFEAQQMTPEEHKRMAPEEPHMAPEEPKEAFDKTQKHTHHFLSEMPPAPPSGAKRLPPLEDTLRSKASLAGLPLPREVSKPSLVGYPVFQQGKLSLAGYAATQKALQPKLAELPQHKVKRQVYPVVAPLPMSEVLQQAGSSAVQTTRERAPPESCRAKPSRPRSMSPEAAYQHHLKLSGSGAGAVGAPQQWLRELRRSSSAVGKEKPTPPIQVPRLQLNQKRDDAPVNELDILTEAALPPSAWYSGRKEKDPVPLPSYRGVQRVQRSKSAAALPSSRGKDSSRPSSRRAPAGLPPPLEFARLQQAAQGPSAPRRSKSEASARGDGKDSGRRKGQSKAGAVERGLRTALRAGRVLAGGLGLMADDGPLSRRESKEPRQRPSSGVKRSPSAPGILHSARGARPSGVMNA